MQVKLGKPSRKLNIKCKTNSEFNKKYTYIKDYCIISNLLNTYPLLVIELQLV